MSRPGGAVTVRAARNASRPRATVPGTKPPGIRAREGHLQSATHSCVTYGPYVTQNRKEGPHMSTKSALRADLDAEDRKTLAEDASRAADEIKPYRQPVLATGRVRYVGAPVAAVFAEDPYVAEDAADLVEVEIEPLSTLMSATDPPGALATSMR